MRVGGTIIYSAGGSGGSSSDTRTYIRKERER
jgi:hypothetical protein